MRNLKEHKKNRVVIAGTTLPNDLVLEKAKFGELDIELVDARHLVGERLSEELAQATAILTEGFIPLDSDAIKNLKLCKVISFMSIGVETIDLAAATAQSIIVTNCPDYCTDEVADHTLLLCLAAWRKLEKAIELSRASDWRLDSLQPIGGLKDRTLGLVGFGGIARAVSSRARAFGLKSIAFDPFLNSSDVPHDIPLLSLNEVCCKSDILSIHVPLNSKTKGLIGREQISLLKSEAIVVNTSRGGVIDEAALYDALNKNKIGGAALDVLAKEPPQDASTERLISLKNVICTPHMAYYSEDSLRRVREQAMEALLSTLSDGYPKNRAWVNRAMFKTS